MGRITMTSALMVFALTNTGLALGSAGDGRYHDRPYEGREWKSESRDGPCQIKREQKGRDSLLEVKCKDGVGARWRGEWKEEYRDGPCVVKVDAKRDEYKEEVKCDRSR